MNDYKNGLKKGFPIFLGYLPVSFTFGFMAVSGGLPVWLAVFISVTNLTSAGQFAGTNLIFAHAGYLEIALTTFVINLRYSLMSLSLSQKIDRKTPIWKRLIVSYGITDEIFAVASLEADHSMERSLNSMESSNSLEAESSMEVENSMEAERSMESGGTEVSSSGTLSAAFLFGLITLPFAGWTIGTFLGGTVSTHLPVSLQNAMGIGLYAMFIALIIPASREKKEVRFVVVLAIIFSCLLKYAPLLSSISSGFRIIIATVLAAGIGAFLFPENSE
jgi:predicted branched-subunit amino acid permease